MPASSVEGGMARWYWETLPAPPPPKPLSVCYLLRSWVWVWPGMRRLLVHIGKWSNGLLPLPTLPACAVTKEVATYFFFLFIEQEAKEHTSSSKLQKNHPLSDGSYTPPHPCFSFCSFLSSLAPFLPTSVLLYGAPCYWLTILKEGCDWWLDLGSLEKVLCPLPCWGGVGVRKVGAASLPGNFTWWPHNIEGYFHIAGASWHPPKLTMHSRSVFIGFPRRVRQYL